MYGFTLVRFLIARWPILYDRKDKKLKENIHNMRKESKCVTN